MDEQSNPVETEQLVGNNEESTGFDPESTVTPLDLDQPFVEDQPPEVASEWSALVFKIGLYAILPLIALGILWILICKCRRCLKRRQRNREDDHNYPPYYYSQVSGSSGGSVPKKFV